MSAIRTIAALLVLVASSLSHAASTAERSPYAQGLWWDPTRPGHGFELWNTSEQAALIWFTYDGSGRPTWYTAAGPTAQLGRDAWPLLQHHWGAGGVRTTSVVGDVRIDVRHAESVSVHWKIGAAQGQWAIEPFAVSGIVNDIDHSGVWFDPSNSGWGVSLTEQGDALGAVLYTYDANGAPTWALGFARGGSRTIDMQAYAGSCPGCALVTATPRSVGNLSIADRSETELTLASGLAVAMPSGVKVDGARVTQLGRPASTRVADRRLATFADDAALTAYLKTGMLNLPPRSGGSFSAAPPPLVFSTTNLHEQGVDEADVVKSDGTQVYTFAHGDYGVRTAVIRVANVGNEGGSLAVVAHVPLAGGAQAPVANAGLFVHEQTLVSLTGTQATSTMGLPWGSSAAWLQGVTNVELFDASLRGTLASRWRVQLDGHLVSSRRIGSRLYVVTRFAPYVPQFVYGATWPEAIDTNRTLLAQTTLADLLPNVRVGDEPARRAVAATDVHLPPPGARPPMADMIVVTAIDLAARTVAQSLAIVGNVETVYASTTDLFVASSRYVLRDRLGFALVQEPSFITTDVHQIRLGADAMRIVGSATVDGMLGHEGDKGAFRMSEHAGRLRIVTSAQMMWGSDSRNRLTILEPSTTTPGLLRTVSFLPNAQRPQTLGKPGEVLYATRFVGDRLYAVTFKRIDPLYIVDAANPGDPRIASALEIPGFSEYLHPLPNGLLLGFGKDAKPAPSFADGQFAWYQGLQLSLFDVRDADRPREIQRVLVGKRGSDSALLRNHHALSVLAVPGSPTRLAFPARVHDGPLPAYPDDSAWYPWHYSGLVRFELAGSDPTNARLVALPTLVTHAANGSTTAPDSSTDDARSVLFRNGTIYVANGRFWRQDAAGATTGPF